jgi:hypothetical protein
MMGFAVLYSSYRCCRGNNVLASCAAEEASHTALEPSIRRIHRSIPEMEPSIRLIHRSIRRLERSIRRIHRSIPKMEPSIRRPHLSIAAMDRSLHRIGGPCAWKPGRYALRTLRNLFCYQFKNPPTVVSYISYIWQGLVVQSGGARSPSGVVNCPMNRTEPVARSRIANRKGRAKAKAGS